MSKTDMRTFPDEVSKEQLKELSTLEEQKRDNLVMSLVMETLSEEYQKMGKHFKERSESVKKASKVYEKENEKLQKESEQMFKRLNMKRMNV